MPTEEARRVVMSVHGEYSRALRHVLERLDEQDPERARRHREALEAAHPTPARDLSTAARAALAALAQLESDPAFATPVDGLRDSCHHLRAHCRAILGAAASDL